MAYREIWIRYLRDVCCVEFLLAEPRRAKDAYSEKLGLQLSLVFLSGMIVCVLLGIFIQRRFLAVAALVNIGACILLFALGWDALRKPPEKWTERQREELRGLKAVLSHVEGLPAACRSLPGAYALQEAAARDKKADLGSALSAAALRQPVPPRKLQALLLRRQLQAKRDRTGAGKARLRKLREAALEAEDGRYLAMLEASLAVSRYFAPEDAKTPLL